MCPFNCQSRVTQPSNRSNSFQRRLWGTKRLSCVERLEERRLLSMVLTVVNTSDSGPGSLRDAITRVNGDASSDIDRINFDIPGTGPFTIRPTSDELPVIRHPVFIDGYSQRGA